MSNRVFIALAAAALFAGFGPHVAMADDGIQPADIPMNALTPDIPYGERVAANDYYDVYYDGAYGLFTDGYWGTDRNYWYLASPASTIWVRDEDGHFRRTPADGFAL